MPKNSIHHLIQQGFNQLKPYEQEARLESEILLAHVLQKNRAYLYTHPENIIAEENINQYLSLIHQRELGKPIAYLIGEKEFYGRRFFVNEHTLIPRPETELLIDFIVGLNIDVPLKIADLGTGSGVIAITLALEYPDFKIFAIDNTEYALEIAKKNAARLNVLDIEFRLGNWLEGFAEKLDMIVSNPPYLAKNDEHLSQGDLRFEPRSALVADENGLADFKMIIKQATNVLKKNGFLIFEHGFEQAELVRTCLTEHGFSNVESLKDLAGHERVSLGRLG